MGEQDLRYPTVDGALEVVRHLGIAPDSIDFTCQDWEYTYPELEQLPDFVRAYTNFALSDSAKRVLGCFIFQTLEGYLSTGAPEEFVHKTLQMLKQDYTIHEPEFRYWSLVDDEEDQRDPEDWWYITRFAREYIEANNDIISV